MAFPLHPTDSLQPLEIKTLSRMVSACHLLRLVTGQPWFCQPFPLFLPSPQPSTNLQERVWAYWATSPTSEGPTACSCSSASCDQWHLHDHSCLSLDRRGLSAPSAAYTTHTWGFFCLLHCGKVEMLKTVSLS